MSNNTGHKRPVITNHAVDRFAERIMRQEIRDLKHKEQIREYMVRLIEESHPSHNFVTRGSLVIKEYEVAFIKEDNRIITTQYCTLQEDPNYVEKHRRRKQNRKELYERKNYFRGKAVTRKIGWL